ncbi:hypothetical protein BH09ACT7_BH09ACT7_08530 [soil metagenome]
MITYADCVPDDPKPKARPLGPTGEAVRANLVQIREAKRIPVTRLSERLETLGRHIPPLGIRRIEAGERRVDVDDLMAIAVALDVSPITLLVPGLNSEDEHLQVSVTGVAASVEALSLWNWVGGQAPPWFTGSVAQYISAAWPRWLQDKFNFLEVPSGDNQ